MTSEALKQIVYALERQERALQAQADRLNDQLDYSAEFPAEDAQRMREAIQIVSAASEPPPKTRLPDHRDKWSLHRLNKEGFTPYTLRRLGEALWKPGNILNSIYQFANRWEMDCKPPASSSDAQDARRYRWVSDRFLGADFDWNSTGSQVLLIKFDGVDVYGKLDLTVDTALKGEQP